MSYWSGGYGGWEPRKSAAERRADAARKIAEAARRGAPMSPVRVTGRKIAQTFWGKAWCDNLERYQDFAYRLDRGRSYLRSGSVIDLQISAGKVTAKVSGSSLYEVAIEIDAVERPAWRAIQRDCAGGVGSRIDLLSGRLSEPVMARLCADRTGMFPAPSVIRFSCSCPDHAAMCKHVAATMYGVGARLDHAPELLFTLRGAALDELLAAAVSELPPAVAADRMLASGGLAALFGIELADPAPTAAAAGRPKRATATPKPATASTASNAGPVAPAATLSAATAKRPTPRAKLDASTAKRPAPGAVRTAPTATRSAPTANLTPPPGERATPSAQRKASAAKQPAPTANLRPPAAKRPAPSARLTPSAAKRPAPSAKLTPPAAKRPAPSVKLTPPAAKRPASRTEVQVSTAKRPAPSTKLATSNAKRVATGAEPVAASSVHSAQQFAHAMQQMLDELVTSTTRLTRGKLPAAARPRSPARQLAAGPSTKRSPRS